jgi:hypothetical protein
MQNDEKRVPATDLLKTSLDQGVRRCKEDAEQQGIPFVIK